MSKLNFNERIEYNFGIKEINKGEFQRLVKENSDDIKKLFNPFEKVKVDIQEFGITIYDNFGIIGKLNFNVESNKIESPSEILLNFVANTYLKIDCWEK